MDPSLFLNMMKDVFNLEQQLGEMNVARGRAVEAIQNRLELGQERGDGTEVIALEDMLNEYTSM